MSTGIPVAAYGSLRVGGEASDTWAGLAMAEPAFVRGYELRAVKNAWFPILVPAEPDATVRVDLLRWYDKACYLEGMRRLDFMEGYPDLYKRAPVPTYQLASSLDLMQTAWLYMPADSRLLVDATPVAHGDWIRYLRERWDVT